jgi:hypothetical protein
MIFNKDTTLEHLPLTKQGFYEADNGEIHVLFFDYPKYFVASFSADGFCVNAASYMEKREAWKLFISLVEGE